MIHRLPSHASQAIYNSPFELVLCDLWGPAPMASSCGYKYMLTCFNTKLKSIQTDGGREFRTLIPSQHMVLFTELHVHILTIRMVQLNASTVMLLKPALHSLHKLVCPSILQMKSPYFCFFNQVPNYLFLKGFGCACYPHIRPYIQHKLAFHSKECVFLGYSNSHRGYKCLAPDGRIFVSKDVLFNEHQFPYYELFQQPSSFSAPTVTQTLPLPVISSSIPSPLATENSP
ncbi:hypothetical protein CR513_31185, partial [Mucuna pruriens]